MPPLWGYKCYYNKINNNDNKNSPSAFWVSDTVISVRVGQAMPL